MRRVRWIYQHVRSLATYWRELSLALVSSLLMILVPELGYRAYQYWTLPGTLLNLVSTQTAQTDPNPSSAQSRPRYTNDSYAGYVYTPNLEGQYGHPWYSRWRTNSHGHVSQFEYPKQKPSGEYRIAVVGDSMTANITNNIRWTEVLEASLNASPEWNALVGNRFTRVINFAVDGMGMVQFAGMVRHHAPAFEPDLTMVHFVSDDILRRLRYIGIPNSREDGIRTFVQAHLDEIDWFSACPELITAMIGSRLGLRCALPLDPKELLASARPRKYSDRKEAIATSVKAVTDMMAAFSNILFLQIPLFHELEDQDIPDWRGLVEDLSKAVPQAKIVSMRPQMDALLEGKRPKDRPDLAGMTLHQITALPDNRKLEIYRWFFLPEDAHYTDYGITLYAHEVAKLLIKSPVLDRLATLK
jgi:hypothetical protein